ncbi:MAG TPA: TIGR01777 family oxidoreductase [Terriglobales bacterium]|nr:TIGR01777 family oxidoreductase [Terriglobales bacterium]
MARILISGASGLIGSSLATFFESHRDEVTRLVRRRPRSSDERQWDPMREIPPHLVSAFDVVVHLSGESVSGRWNEAKKKRIRGSRVITTQNLARALVEAEIRPKVFVCASAIGYYGDRGNEVLTEDSPAGNGFLAEVSREWESATAPAADAGIRTANLRTGIVLSREGGALKQILLPFRLGLGGRVGDGRQWWSWIHIDDFVAAIQRIVDDTKGGASPGLLSGPINMTSPNPVTNDEFTRTLARVLKRPAVLPVPAFAARLAFGEFAQEGLLSSARVQPKKLLEAGFQFRFPRLEMALSELIAKPE